MDSSKDKIIAAVIFVILVVLSVSTSRAAGQKDGLLKVYFLDVGQGDAILIESPSGNQVLIDGGPDSRTVSELSKVMPFYDRSLDAVIVSHPHSDHIAGLIDVLEQYDVATVIQAGESYDSAIFRTWQEAIRKEGAATVDAIAGRRINMGADTTITVLHPLRSVIGTSTKEPHEDTVVVMLQHKYTKMLFTGDMEADKERFLLQQGIDLDADVLKVGHHGSRTSTSPVFLNAVSPQTAIIQVGAKNRYKHPHSNTISNLETSNIKYYRTDTDGMIRLTSDGTTFAVTVAN